MEKTAKIISVILGVIAVILFVIYLILCGVNKTIPKELVYPESGLSQSIFDSQNIKYIANENYNTKHSFLKCPYTVDLPEVDAAKVGEYGNVYKVSDSMYFYMTEFAKDTSVESVLRTELSPAVMVDSNSDMTAIDNYVYDEGYFNGFKADYYIDGMTVTNGNRTVTVYITGYILTITDTEYDHGYKMFIGCMASSNDTDTYANAKGIVDSVVATFQINGSTQNTLCEEEEYQRSLEEEAIKQAQENGENVNYNNSTIPSSGENMVVSTDNSSSDFASNATQGVPANNNGTNPSDNPYIRNDAILNKDASSNDSENGTSNIPARKVKNMTLSEEYTAVTLYYYFENKDAELTIYLTSPDGSEEYTPTSVSDGVAIFKLDKMSVGKWTVTINGDAGQDSMRLYSESMED